MSADLLRKAASLMREWAEAATSGPWWPERDAGVGHIVSAADGWVAPVGEYEGARQTAQHIASWHPAVALAVADLLIEASVDWPEHPAALAVARAYLGDPS